MYQPKTITGKDLVENGQFLVYGANGVIGRYNKFNHEKSQLLITCRGATCGTVNVSAPRSWITGNAMVVRAKDTTLEMRFLEYLFRGGIDLSKAITGAAQPQITRTNLEPLQICYPNSTTEQKRIVEKLDEAFVGLTKAKENAEKNLQNARALFDSHLESIFTQRGKGWVEKRLKEVCEKITDGTHQTPKYFNEGIVFLSSRNVTSGTIDWENIKYIDTKQHLEMHKRVAPRRDDILLAKNGTTGVAAIVDRDTVFDIYVSLAHLRALDVIRPRFLLHFINSPVAKLQFNRRLKGIGVPNLHLEEIREVCIAYPSDPKVQDHVAAALDELAEETQRLARIYEQKLEALESLKKSILHEAFSGNL
jgi:type I restriction enzyme S subunit